ncbi:Uncharacterised protein [Chromobacterium violaceum]|uniref:Uncharacterized protein n=1 Tax=Chromobacterium violaceum TaxID=536 RepID=A0A3S4HGD7_CHRVL|nr:Uncharacterised protein [Chromobacterium violaceum]
MKKQLFWFGVVGVSAMLLHFALVTLVLVPLGAPPLAANVLASSAPSSSATGATAASLSKPATCRTARRCRASSACPA